MTLREWQQLPKEISSLIVQASRESGDDGPTECSIGMWYNFYRNREALSNYHKGCHTKLVLNHYNENTDDFRRGKLAINRRAIIKTLEKNNIPFTQKFDDNFYYSELPTYKFIISPEGNGVDCHRHYEALIAGCIPVVETNELIISKYGDCPILFTKDYTEITPDFLIKKYNEMIDRTYNFDKLFIESWPHDSQTLIKKRGNYWMLRLTGNNWYN